MKRSILLVYCFLFFCSFGQDRETGLLIQQAQRMKPDTNKVKALNDLAWALKYDFPEKSLELCDQSLGLSATLGFSSGTANAYKIKGILYDGLSDFPKSIAAYDKAIFHFRKANDKLGIAKVEVNIAMLYRKLRRNEEAIRKFKQSLVVFKKYGFTQGEYLVHSNLAVSYSELEHHQKALDHIQRAYVIMKKLGIEDPNIYGNLGNSYQFLGKPDEAIYYYEKAILLENNQRSAVWLHNLGLTYESEGQLDKALTYYLRVLASNPEIYQEMRTRQQLSRLYRKLGKYGNALSEMDTFVVIRDSIMTIETSRQLSELTRRHDSEKKRLQILSLRRQRNIHADRAGSERRQKYIYAGFGALFLVLGAMLLRTLHLKGRSQAIILEQKSEVELQKKMVDTKNREILDSISYAKRLQDTIFPESAYWDRVFGDSFILFKPKDIVTGDFYWLEQRDVVSNGKLSGLTYFAVADCTGHGVPGAIVSVVCRNALSRSLNEYGLSEPGELLDRTHELIMEAFRRGSGGLNDGMDISLCCLNRETLELKWAGANNALWFKNPGDAEITEIKPNKQPIGSYHAPRPFLTHTVQLVPGSVIYLFSDGYADQFGGPEDKKYRTRVLREQLLAVSDKAMEQQGQVLEHNFQSWKGAREQVDDVLVIGIRITDRDQEHGYEGGGSGSFTGF
jgi:tetratricopeptide (TPR) repeat protein